MSDFSEADLLALIEGELAPKQAARLRQRLAGDPQMAALVQRLQDDRQMLRTMDEPPLPADLITELEPMLARPMLMPVSGDWRQRYKPRRPWRRYAAIAAVVCMALLAGVWAAASGLLGGGAERDPMFALQMDPSPDAAWATQSTCPPGRSPIEVINPASHRKHSCPESVELYPTTVAPSSDIPNA